MARDHYAEGQRDGARGVYSPPHGVAIELITFDKKMLAQMREDNRLYRAGYENAKKQRK